MIVSWNTLFTHCLTVIFTSISCEGALVFYLFASTLTVKQRELQRRQRREDQSHCRKAQGGLQVNLAKVQALHPEPARLLFALGNKCTLVKVTESWMWTNVSEHNTACKLLQTLSVLNQDGHFPLYSPTMSPTLLLLPLNNRWQAAAGHKNQITEPQRLYVDSGPVLDRAHWKSSSALQRQPAITWWY